MQSNRGWLHGPSNPPIGWQLPSIDPIFPGAPLDSWAILVPLKKASHTIPASESSGDGGLLEEPLDQRNVVALLQSTMELEPLTGARVIDATAGNGHDTAFLARLIGPDGRLLAVDLQAAAVHGTRERLSQSPELAARTSVIEGNHAALDALVPSEWHGDVAFVLFNLGYLPGGGRTLTTTAATSVPAAEAALTLLRPGGLLALAVYTGHQAGAAEAAALREWAARQHGTRATVRLLRDTGTGAIGRPEVLLIRRLADPENS